MTAKRSQMHIGVLSTPESYYARELRRAAAQLADGPYIHQLNFADLHTSLGIKQPNQSSTPRLDAVIVRSMPLGSLEQVIFRMDCLAAWLDQGIEIVNPPKALETAIDKWLTLQRLAHHDIAVPATVACQSRDVAMTAFEDLGGDVVVKPIFGGEGRGIVRVQDAQVAWRVFGTLQQTGQVLYVQEFIEHLGYDIRVLKVGDALHCIHRHATGTWLTNVSQGSQAVAHPLTDQQRSLAEKAAAIVGGSVLGIDLLPTQDGRLLVLEVNAVPGWKATARALGRDISADVIKHVSDRVLRR
ncbi:MAG: ATP-grasp domain-containing protein [Aureliella sp.]